MAPELSQPRFLPTCSMAKARCYQRLIDFCHFVIDMFLGIEETGYTKRLRDRGFMPYERTRQIEMRFHEAVRLIAMEPHNARQLAAALKVSTATVQRLIAEMLSASD